MKELGMGAKALKGLNAVGRVGGISQWGSTDNKGRTHKQTNIMANKGQITKRLVQSKAGKQGIQKSVGLVKSHSHGSVVDKVK